MQDSRDQLETIVQHNEDQQERGDALHQALSGDFSEKLDVEAAYEDANKPVLDAITDDRREPEGKDEQTDKEAEHKKTEQLKVEINKIFQEIKDFFTQYNQFMVVVQNKQVQQYLQQKLINPDKFEMFMPTEESNMTQAFLTLAQSLDDVSTIKALQETYRTYKGDVEDVLQLLNRQLNNLEAGELQWLNNEIARTRDNPEADGMQQWQFDELNRNVGTINFEFVRLQEELSKLIKHYTGVDQEIETLTIPN